MLPGVEVALGLDPHCRRGQRSAGRRTGHCTGMSHMSRQRFEPTSMHVARPYDLVQRWAVAARRSVASLW